MPGSYSDIEKRILDACTAAQSQKKQNISALARQFDVPYYRLRARIQGRATRSTRPISTKTLNNVQEKALIRWIRQLDNLYRPPTAGMIEQSANQILQRNTIDGPPRTVDKNWVYRFIKRLPSEFQLIQQKPKDKNRLDAEEVGVLQHWYDCLEPIVKQIPPKNIYNFDETGFQLGQGKSQKVVTTMPVRAARGNPSKEMGELISAIECIAADGFVLPPYFIFKGVHHLERWYDADIPHEYRIALSPKGYTSDKISLDWIQHFHRHTKCRISKKEVRLLLFDGHESHLTYEFLQFCGQHYIVPYCFPPHTTHLVQPLDGQPFQAYKHFYRKRNNELASRGAEMDDKSDFLKQIHSIRTETFKQRTIRHAFEKRGIYPLNSEPVLKPLNKALESAPELQIITTPSPPPSSSSPPSTIRGLRRSISKAQSFIDNSPELNQSFVRRLNRVFQSSLETTELAAQLKDDLQQHLRYQKPQNRRKSQRRVRYNGPLTVYDAKRHIADRTEVERLQNLRQIRKAGTLEHNKPPQQEDIGDLPSTEASQMDKEGPRLPFWIDTQGDVV